MESSAAGFHLPFPTQHHFAEHGADVFLRQSHICVVPLFVRPWPGQRFPSINSEVGEMRACDHSLPRGEGGITTPDVAGFVNKLDDPLGDCVPQTVKVVVVEHIENVIELLPTGYASPAQILPGDSRTKHAEVQHVETGFDVRTRPCRAVGRPRVI